jgi:hypothetical protein
MIYKFDTTIEYQQLLISLQKGSGEYDKCLVFDLDTSMVPGDVPVSIYECRTCNLVEVYFKGEKPANVCYSCGGNMQCDQSVDVIIQDDIVVYRSDVFWYGSDGPVY